MMVSGKIILREWHGIYAPLLEADIDAQLKAAREAGIRAAMDTLQNMIEGDGPYGLADAYETLEALLEKDDK